MPRNDDFVSLEDLVSNAIPDGTYKVRVGTIEPGVSSQKKTPQVKVQVTIKGGESDGHTDYIFYYLSPGGIKMLGFDLLASGVKNLRFPRPFDGAGETYAQAIADILRPMEGKDFQAKVTTETDDRGIDRNRYRLVGTADGTALSLDGAVGARSEV